MYRECRHIQPERIAAVDAASPQGDALLLSPRPHPPRSPSATVRAEKQARVARTRGPPPPSSMALSHVIGALAAGRLDGADAGRLIYGLQVAAQYAPHLRQHRPPLRSGPIRHPAPADGDELAHRRNSTAPRKRQTAKPAPTTTSATTR